MGVSDDLAAIIEPVARTLLGEPNARLSSKRELRFGSRGSVAVALESGTYFDHEQQRGGGVLDLIEHQTGLLGPERFKWLTDNGFGFERREEPQPQPRKPNGGNGHADSAPPVGRASGPPRGTIEAVYPYHDEVGELLFEVVRYRDPRGFRQRRPNGKGGYIWSTSGTRQVIYRLPDILEQIALFHIIFVVEGEKDAENLWRIGIPATCNAGGVGKWSDELSASFVGADVIIIPDHDPQKKHPKSGAPMFHSDGRPILPGQDHAHAVAASLIETAGRVRYLDLAQHWPQMPDKGDVSDWLAAGGTADALYALVDQAVDWSPELTEPVIDIPVVFPFPINGEEIPRRPWLVPGLVLRKQVTVMVAPPGSGKSLLTLQLAMVCSAGTTSWNGWRPRGRFRVLMINSEEDHDEMLRRFYAAHKVMNIPDELLSGVVMAESPEDIVVAEHDNRTKTVIATPMKEQIIATIRRQKIDIVIVDPFSETFKGDENDNSQLKWAAVLWREVARRTNVAILLVHHTKKYAQDMAGDPDAGRGGGSLTGVARIVSTLFPMTEREEELFKKGAKSPEERDRIQRIKFIRYDDAKANLTLKTLAARWFEKKTYVLPNGNEIDPADEVGVLVPWEPPSGELTEPETIKILDELAAGVKDDQGMPTGDPFSLTKQGGRWAGNVIKRFRPAFTDTDVNKKILDLWIANGLIEEVEVETSTGKGKKRLGIRVVPNKRPGIISQDVL
jgi:hypothetical protein